LRHALNFDRRGLAALAATLVLCIGFGARTFRARVVS